MRKLLLSAPIPTIRVLSGLKRHSSLHYSGLEPGEFRVFENGIEQRIDRVIADSAPFHTALLMDNSPSTAISGKDIAKSALDFLSTLRLGDASMMLSFGDQIHIDSEFTEDANRLRHTILGRDVANVAPSFQQHELSRWNLTRFYDAVDLTLTERMSKIIGRKAILVFTDGLDVGSRLANAGTLLERVEESGVLIYAIKYETPDPKLPNKVAQKGITAAYAEGAEYLRNLTTNSGGRLLNVKSAVDVEQAFSLIADELHHQYMICYYPTDRNMDGAFRRINVVVDKPGVRVRARTGYRQSSR
jgi:Ca-activated chloride channel family protein